MGLLPMASLERTETLAMPSVACVHQQQRTLDTSSRVTSGLGDAAQMESEGSWGGGREPCGRET